MCDLSNGCLRMAGQLEDVEDKFASGDENDFVPGKVVAERYISRFSPTKESGQTSYFIEERQHYSVSADRSLKAIGNKHYIFREGGRMDYAFQIDDGKHDIYTQIGRALHVVDGLRDERELNNPTDHLSDGDLVMALYCMNNHEIFDGKGIELGSGDGVGGILSIIGAEVASKAASTKYQADRPKATPSSLSEIVFTDSNKDLLNICIDNLRAASIPPSTVTLGILDWTKSIQDDFKHQFNFVIAHDCGHDPLPLAEAVASSLKNSSCNKFVHIEPQHGKSEDDSSNIRLQYELESGHNMDISAKDVVLERIHLTPLVMDSMQEAEEMLKNESKVNFFSTVEHESLDSSTYSVIEGSHHDDDAEKEKQKETETSETMNIAQESNLKENEGKAKKLINASRPEMEAMAKGRKEKIRSIYEDWCAIYGKEVEESRFLIFLTNFLMLHSHNMESGEESIELNEWFDCTEEHYMELMNNQKQKQTQTHSSCFYEGIEEEVVNPEVIGDESPVYKKQAWYQCTQEEYVALNSGRAELKVVENVEDVLDVDYIDLGTLFAEKAKERERKRKAYHDWLSKESKKRIGSDSPYQSSSHWQ
jgi:hypothetical protein